MKKKLTAALCALAILLTGCNNSVNESAAESSSKTDSVISSASEITETTEPVGGEITPEPAGTPVALTPFGGAEKLEIPISVGNISNVNNGRLLALSNTEELQAALINLDDLTYTLTDIDTSRAEPNPEYNGYLFMPVFIGGYPALVDMFTGEIRLMNDELSVIDTLILDIEIIYPRKHFDNKLCLRSYGSDEYYLISAEDGKLYSEKRKLNSGAENVQDAVFLSETESIISVYDPETYRTNYYLLNSEKGSKTALNIGQDESFFCAEGKIYLYNYLENEVTCFDPARPAIKSSFSFPKDVWMIGSIEKDSMYVCTESPEKLLLSRIFLETGMENALLEIDKDESDAGILWSVVESGDAVYITGCFNGENILLRWKPVANSVQSGWTALEKPDYSRLTYETAQEIRSKYGINVVYGNEAVRYFNDYAVVSETDERKICSALTALKTVFGKYPEGFLRELTGYKNVEVLLTGDILSSGQSRNSITTADAFTFEEENSEIVVIDVGISNMNETIAHEFMHVMENVLFSAAVGDYTRELFNLWGLLNKPGFEYAYIYTHEDGTTIDDYSPDYGNYYYEGCGVDVNDIYFVDGYSTTFPTEDRARLFQKMLIFADDMPEYFKGENINNKAAYLCLCLRDCFRSLDGCEDIVWERGIKIEHDLDWYHANYSWEDYAAG